MNSALVYIQADDVCSPLGNGTAAVLDAMLSGQTGLQLQQLEGWEGRDICAALFQPHHWAAMQETAGADLTPFETLLLSSIRGCLKNYPVDLSHPRTLLVLASTKGNIGLLQPEDALAQEHTALVVSSAKIAKELGYHGDPLLVSNACISGLSALLVAKRLMQAGLYDRAVVAGADCLSPFIVAGFQSFQALSSEPCQPFDEHRKGINLGEGAATMILNLEPSPWILSGGATSSDANHISGPSRTGEEMAHAIRLALQEAGVQETDLGFISAHGTATSFNDEMESKAFFHNGLTKTPVFSLKPYFGHTLGAAGLLEAAISLEALRRNVVLGSPNYKDHGVSSPITVATQNQQTTGLNHLLKTGSGFGGCNAAIVISKAITSSVGQ
ncbi:beta-ketoacyl-[acyl-carrier-protein] synthase family protein [Flavihumibacter petaseus]|uniref:Putative 3-oxoacyl-[acyl-carrier-protein] synthase n=1 Tax=Flavihumibacter petaseus NBRC 106054 TaxID=1220578 RepID=A0A0E9MWX5_9BACT|nr:beta-ketoacyl synthase N-terminal-like domain-containing protein [Flavihumibacter petaseus]GAO42089.1 putative 3-oxoacyl-[acyl-carrier-protein] synthase [Flavihumibacter petaseus NBRC 106054]